MSPELANLLRQMEDTSQKNGGVPRIAREAGQFLSLLVKAMQATNILEVGAGDGYATLWLAEGAQVTNGAITSIENDVWQLEVARETIARSPHASRITLLCGDALELLPVLEGPFDFVLLDADKTEALSYLHILLEQLRSGAVICCDKAISKAGALASYLTYVHDRPGLDSVLIPIGEGIEVTYKVP